MNMELTKMEGLGNTFVILQGPFSPMKQEIIAMCKGYGQKPADGLLVASSIDDRTVRMKYWNNDGSQAEMCGNGLRCLAKFAKLKGLIDASSFTVETDAGPLKVKLKGGTDMVEAQIGKVRVAKSPIKLSEMEFLKANVGNPHAITFVDDISTAPVTTLGPIIEVDSHFPDKTNVEFVQILDKNRVKLRTWERGVGETLACGTAMAATSAALVEYVDGYYPITVEVLGGKAKLWLDEDGYIRMLGPAKVVAEV